MELSKCVRCDRLFTKVKYPVCPACQPAEDREIREVQNFIRDHPQCTLAEVSDTLNVYLEDMERWIGDGRLTLVVRDPSQLKCVFCGVPILTGRICAECTEKMTRTPAPTESKTRPVPPAAGRSRMDSPTGSARKYTRE
jgi:hypothetical protein